MKLKDIADYVTEKISSDAFDLDSYITTDSLLQNKAGRDKAVNMPPQTCMLTRYKVGDILVANIRPYLKKVWMADIDGGCNADVLVFRAKSNHSANFLYAVLLQDACYTYAMKGAKGSKMPRGDKDQIMRYKIPMLSSSEESIGNFSVDINAKIALNREINRNLEAMAHQLYDYWFVQFDFPDENGRPYKSSGGKMVWNDKLKQLIPEGWTHITIERYANIQNGATPSTSNELNYGGDIVWITPKDLSDQSQKFTFKGERSITNAGYKSCSTTLLPKGTVLMSSRAPIGLLSIAALDLCTNQGFKSLVPKNESEQRFLYYLVDQYLPFIKQMGSGTTFREVSKDELAKLKVPDVPSDLIEKWDNEAKSLFDRQEIILKEIDTLTKQRDELLPLLMNGQVSVMPSEVNCDLSHD